MTDKPKYVAITDPDLADELADSSDLAKPFTWKPNGHLWADAEQFEAWRSLRGINDER